MAKPDLQTIFITGDKDVGEGELAIGSDGHLYWNGERLATIIKLTTQQGIGAWVVVIAAGLTGILTLLQIFDRFNG